MKSTQHTKRLLIMAAGTGGHIFPGLSIARAMQARGWQVSWLGTTQGMERDIVPQHGIDMDLIPLANLRGKGWRHALRGVWRLLFSCLLCFRSLGRSKPDLVLGMGGYVTVPGGLMAKLRGIPVVLMNADAALLLSNKILSPFAQRVLFGFAADFGWAKNKALVTGNAVRQDMLHLPTVAERYAARRGVLRVLVVGGSLGAKVLNECVPAALALLPEAIRPIVTHQSGKQHVEALRTLYANAQVNAEVLDFIDDMSARYAQADVVICRAGAITVSELTAAGVASVLVPLLASTTSHQHNNAVWMAEQKAALHLPQSELNPAKLADLLQTITREDCGTMAQKAYAIGVRDADQRIANVLEQVAKK